VQAVQAIMRAPEFAAAKSLVGGPAFEHEEAREAIRSIKGGTGPTLCLASNFSEAVEFARVVARQNHQS